MLAYYNRGKQLCCEFMLKIQRNCRLRQSHRAKTRRCTSLLQPRICLPRIRKKKEKADADSRTWAKLIGESTKEIKETSETVKSKIEAVEEKTENIAKQTEETQAFQKTLEDFKKKIGKDENKWGKISVGTVLITSLIFIGVFIIYIFFTKEAKSFFPAYFLFTFFSIVSFTVLRIYTSIKKHRIEAENRLAMAKMLAHIENTDNKLITKEYYQKQFLPELAKVIITPLYPDKNQKTDGTNLAEMIKNLLKK